MGVLHVNSLFNFHLKLCMVHTDGVVFGVHGCPFLTLESLSAILFLGMAYIYMGIAIVQSTMSDFPGTFAHKCLLTSNQDQTGHISCPKFHGHCAVYNVAFSLYT